MQPAAYEPNRACQEDLGDRAGLIFHMELNHKDTQAGEQELYPRTAPIAISYAAGRLRSAATDPGQAVGTAQVIVLKARCAEFSEVPRLFAKPAEQIMGGDVAGEAIVLIRSQGWRIW
jgi:hypothetical protein